MVQLLGDIPDEDFQSRQSVVFPACRDHCRVLDGAKRKAHRYKPWGGVSVLQRLFVISLHVLSDLKLYQNADTDDSVSSVESVMLRDKSCQFRTALHFADNQQVPVHSVSDSDFVAPSQIRFSPLFLTGVSKFVLL